MSGTAGRLTFLLLAACDAPEVAPVDRGLCDAMLSCAAEVAPSDLGSLQDQYGEAGTCFAADEALCRQACESALVGYGLASAVAGSAATACSGFGWAAEPDWFESDSGAIVRSTCDPASVGDEVTLELGASEASLDARRVHDVKVRRSGALWPTGTAGECVFAPDGSCEARLAEGTLTLGPSDDLKVPWTFRFDTSDDGCRITLSGKLVPG